MSSPGGHDKAPGGFADSRRYTVDPGALCRCLSLRFRATGTNRGGDAVDRETWTLPQLLSPDRMAPYLAVRRNDWGEALALYDWNMRIGSAFFESIHFLEVGLRNAFDLTIRDRVQESWLDDSSSVLTPRSRVTLKVAADHAGGVTAPRGKLLAELPFGFWWSLLSDEYNRRLWQPALQHAFEGRVRRRRLHRDLNEVRRLRNRIAHHEPIHTRDLGSDFARLLDTSGRLSETLRNHIASTTRIPEVLSEQHDQ